MAYLGRLAWKGPLVADFGRLPWERCLVADWGRLASDRPPLFDFGIGPGDPSGDQYEWFGLRRPLLADLVQCYKP